MVDKESEGRKAGRGDWQGAGRRRRREGETREKGNVCRNEERRTRKTEQTKKGDDKNVINEG